MVPRSFSRSSGRLILDPLHGLPARGVGLSPYGRDDLLTLKKKKKNLKDGMVLYKNRIYIPDSNDLKLTVTKQCYDVKIANHFDRDKTLELLQRNYCWPNLEERVKNCVRTYNTCQCNKSTRHKKYGPLKPLDLPYRPWEHISRDFITDLSKVSGYSQI